MKNEFLLSSNIPDPSDFPPNNSSPGLRNLDRSLRCMICGELFDAPVTLACGHCFCSLCVRTAMAEKQECPGCRKTVNELHIRPNPGMEEVVAAWKLSRPYVLELSKEDERRRNFCTDGLATPNPKKRKIVPERRRNGKHQDDVTSNDGLGQPLSPLKLMGKRGPSPEDDGLDIMTIPTSDLDESELDANLGVTGPDDQVPCPLCNKSVKFKNINRHIDGGCRDTPSDSVPSKQFEWARLMGGGNKGKQKEIDTMQDERLPKVSYGTLKDKKLKEMLAEHKLTTHGDRNLLIQRHQQWVILFNANLDRSSSVRKSKPELRKELKRWEDERVKKKKTVVEDGATYEKLHKHEFDELVKAVRKKNKGSPLLSDEGGRKSLPAPFSSPNEDIIVDSEEERDTQEVVR